MGSKKNRNKKQNKKTKLQYTLKNTSKAKEKYQLDMFMFPQQ